MYFQKYDGADGKWYWRLRANNNKTVAQGEGYESESNVDRAINMLQDFGQEITACRVETLRGSVRASAVKASTSLSETNQHAKDTAYLLEEIAEKSMK